MRTHCPFTIVSLCLCVLAFLLACKSENNDDEQAALAAKEYYDHLRAGRYDAYLSGIDGYASLPDGYREELLANARQFMAQQDNEHNGIRDIRVSRAMKDTTFNCTFAYLVLCFGDSTNEEIMVPMVRNGEHWMMK